MAAGKKDFQPDDIADEDTSGAPTPEEIRTLCDQIEAGWTDEERQRRMHRIPKLALEQRSAAWLERLKDRISTYK